MRAQDPHPGRPLPRLAAALCCLLLLAAVPVRPAPAASTEVVDPVNGFSLRLPAGWSAAVPAAGALDGATVLRKRRPDRPPALAPEGEVTGESLKIQLTTVERDLRLPAAAVGDGWPMEPRPASESSEGTPAIGPLATRVAGLDAVVSTRRWPSGAIVLEVAMAAGEGRVLVADLMPAGSPSLLEALAILETIRVAGLPGDAAPAAGSALGRASRLLDLLPPPAPSMTEGGLLVSNPVGGSVLLTRGTYRIVWSPSGSGAPVAIELLDAAGAVALTIAPAAPDVGRLSWVVPGDEGLSGTYSVRVTGSAGSGQSGAFTISDTCGSGSHDGAEAPESPITLHMPFQIGTSWTVGGGGYYYGRGTHCNRYNDYYATDWNRPEDEGEPVLAVADGIVTATPACDESAFGCSVTVDHGDGFSTLYAHLNARYVLPGQFVRVGYHLGDLGNTGNSTAPHLHLRFHDSGSSRCYDVAGALCPNGEEPRAPQSAKPSPMKTWNGIGLVDADLVDGGSYVAGNGIRVTAPAGGEVFTAGQRVAIRWQSQVVEGISIYLWKNFTRWTLFRGIVNDGVEVWTVPDTLPDGDDYRIEVSNRRAPGVKDFSEEFAIGTTPSCSVSIRPPTLPPGAVGQPYAESLTLAGASPPVAMTVVEGALPEGLELSPDGDLEGVPTRAETAGFTVEAEDAEGCVATREYTLSIFGAVAEACNGVDDDGDGQIDEGGVCVCRTAENGGAAYFFCDARVDWSDAVQACSALGAELVKIEGAVENSWVAAEAAPVNRWIGLTDAAAEGDWRWVDGSPLGPFAAWGIHEPNGGTRENCGQLYHDNAEWNDLNCGWLNGFVCQAEAAPGGDLCLTGNLIYNDIYDEFTGPVDHPVDLAIDDGGLGWNPIGELTPDAAGRFCLPALWTRRYLITETVNVPVSRQCSAVIEPTDPGSSGTCGGDESGCEELNDVEFFCGS